ncbi:PP2C-like domain-containing protein CG9801 [Lycorma delicatula]|uniref:PP2C-like domain-containing protein CG9801 n=1 Tax=Lycorma delicatula TaxID=130591 RepID=UPI003F510227
MMPSFRQKVAGFLRQLSNQAENDRSFDDHKPTSSDCFIQRYLSGKEQSRDEPKILHGRTYQELPPRSLGVLSKAVLVAMTGPNGGLTTVNHRQRHLSISDPDVHFIDEPQTGSSSSGHSKDANSNISPMNANVIPPPPEYATPSNAANNSTSIQKSESVPNACDSRFNNPDSILGVNREIAGVSDWGSGTSEAFGCSTTLYERHPLTGIPAGEPIADSFAIVTRRDSAILCLADGVNWGVKASLAARAAVHGCIDYLNRAIFSWPMSTTTEVFHSLLRSFHAAHTLILQEEGLLTTLTAVVVLPLVTSDRYIACACNVGDSLAYVYSPVYGVREITQGSHDVHRMRDMRDALGALGPVDGQNPELGNLTCSMTEVEPGDIVFLTSDGVSDNLDPVVGKFTGLPMVEAHQRHRLTLLRTEDLLRNGVSGHGPPCSTAKELVSLLIDFVTRLTAAKRRMLEDVELYADSEGGPRTRGKQRARRKDVCAKLAMVPGKLDHATVVAYTVGEFPQSGT